jgi:hypothetical protein
MNKYFFSIIIVLALSGDYLAQPDLKIEPRSIRFEDVFQRYDYTLIYNDGDQPLRIDSLSPSSDYYILDFEDHQQIPLIINPGDTVRLNVILTNFYNITVSDTTDTIWVYSNDPESPRDLRIKIDFFDDDYGNCFGFISDDNLNPLENSKIYFFYYGIYLFDSTSTNNAGNYSKLLPTGNYTVAAQKEGYRVMFSGNTPDPFYAVSVNLDSGQTLNVDIILPQITNSLYSVSGTVIDSTYGTPIDKGVVVIRKGTHTPTLMKPGTMAADSNVYAGFIKSDGSYNVLVEDSSYYFIQGYSEYYLPTYYNTQNYSSVFWQNADSVFIDNIITSKNLFVVRDSSYGGGGAYGYITLPPTEDYDFNGITILAKSLDNNLLYAYNFAKEDGNFYLSNLPYGNYQLVAQKIGLPNAVSNVFTISPQNQNQNALNIKFTLTDIGDGNSIIPRTVQLYNNYPNPFNPSTKIRFSIPNVIASETRQSALTTLKVYDVLGNEIATLVDEEKSAGTYEVNFNAAGLASGIYITTLQVNSIRLSQKIILLK